MEIFEKKRRSNIKEAADVKKIVSDLEKGFGTSDEDKAKTLQLFKGLIFSDDDLAKKYMKKLDKATSEISKEMQKSESLVIEKQAVTKEYLSKRFPNTDIDNIICCYGPANLSYIYIYVDDGNRYTFISGRFVNNNKMKYLPIDIANRIYTDYFIEKEKSFDILYGDIIKTDDLFVYIGNGFLEFTTKENARFNDEDIYYVGPDIELTQKGIKDALIPFGDILKRNKLNKIY